MTGHTIGIVPKEDFAFKIDLCIDDVDTLSDISLWPDTLHPAALNYVNLKGQNDFGYPTSWTSAKLVGEPSTKYRILSFLAQLPSMYLFLLIGFIAVIFLVIRYQYRKLQFYKNFPIRSQGHLYETKPIPEAENSVPKENYKMSAEIAAITKYVEKNMQDDLSIEKIASVIHVSVRQLQRIVKSELDLTPRQYITILRLERAAKLIRETNLTSSEISYRCGFSDASYFGVVFKKYFETTPMEYRNGERGGRGCIESKSKLHFKR